LLNTFDIEGIRMKFKNIDDLREKSQGITLLYVEDDPDIRTSMHIMLKKFLSNITIACDGEEGLKYFSETSYDLVITDIMMPKMTGMEMLAKIKNLNPNQYTVVTSALDDKEHLLELITLGVSKFIPKPITAEFFMDSMYEVISNIYNAKKMQEYTESLQTELVKSTSILEQYKEAVDISSIVSKATPDGTITYVNDEFCKISGFSREELIGKNHRIVRSPHMKPLFFKTLWETILEKKVWSGEIENRKKNGELYYVYSTIIPILDIMGNIIEFISIRSDITALKKAQMENLQKSIDKAISINYQEMLSHLPIASVIVDESSAIQYKNTLFDQQTLFAFSEGNVLKKRIVTHTLLALSDDLFDLEYCSQVCENDEAPSITLDLNAENRSFSLYAREINEMGIYLLCFIPLKRDGDLLS